MTTTKIDLNRWERVASEEDIENYRSLIIIPLKLIDGTQLPPLYFRQGKPLEPLIEDVEGVQWNKMIRISNLGDVTDYCKRVDWWFNNALADDEYKTILNDTFNKYGFNLKVSWDKAINWLKGCTPAQRKTYLHKFIWNWLNKGLTWQMNRVEKGK